MLKDFSPGWMIAAGNTLYLAAFSNGQHGLWKSDGTAAGTVLVNAGVPDILPNQQVIMNGILYFRGYDDTHGWELLRSDGTEAGTMLVKDINPGLDGSDPAYASHFVVDNGTLYFAARNANGYGLWKSDGSEAGTVLVKSIFSPSAGPYQFTVVNHHLYFLNELNNGNKELWISDGTEAGTKPLKDLNDSIPGLPYGYAVTLVGSRSNIYFVANDPNTGFELWTLAELSAVAVTNDVYTVNQGTALVVSAPGVLGNDQDANAGALSAALQTNPTHGVIALHADGSFIYTPTANFAGSDAFTYRASNSSAISATGVVSLTIVPIPNQAPVATNDVFTVTLTGASTLDVLGNDTDANSDGLTISQVTQPAHGTATITNNKIVYAPAADFSGTDSFAYTVSDGKGGSATATVTVHAKAVNHSLFLPLVRR